jgi:ribonuclease III
MTGNDDSRLEERLEYKFVERALLETALTHSSVLPDGRQAGEVAVPAEAPPSDSRRNRNNERFEFLGDAVLELLVSEYLLERFPDWSEGQLSKSRARLVEARSLEAAARRLGLGEYLRLGRGEEKTGGREKPALLADAFEAVLAAIYLDGGLQAAREVLRRVLLQQGVEQTAGAITEADNKSALQEYLQARGESPAQYELAGQRGPDHRKIFEVALLLGGEKLAQAEGRTKKEAEQKAAGIALERLRQAEMKNKAE